MKYILFTTLIASSSAIGLKAFDENDESGIEVANSTGKAGGAANGSTRRNGFNGFNKPVVNPQPKNGFTFNKQDVSDNMNPLPWPQPTDEQPMPMPMPAPAPNKFIPNFNKQNNVWAPNDN